MVKKKSRNENRRTIGAFRAYAAREPGMFTHMFIQDIYVGFMGFRRMADDDERRIDVDGDEAGKAALNAICTSLADYSEYELGETVRSAIESIAMRIAWFGKAVYEICGSAEDPSLASVMPHRLYRIPGGFIQLIPPKDREWIDGRRYTFLPADSA